MTRNRRRWVCIIGLLLILLGVRAAQSLAVPSHQPMGTAEVAIARTGSSVEAAVRQAVTRAGGLGSIVKPGDIVVVKVNLVMDAPADSGMITDPAVARTVVELAREAGAAQVIIAEGTAQYREGDANRDRFSTQAAFSAAGYDSDRNMVDDATNAPLADLNDSGGTDVTDPTKVTKVVVPNGLIRTEYWLPNIVLDADVLISVPVLKNHYLAGVTLGMKNLIGLLPADLYHAPGNIYGKHSLAHGPIELDQHIVDVNLARRPDFVVVDGQRGMIDGPVGSQVIDPPMGLVLAGRDVVAVDTIGALVMGYDPKAIPYLQMAAERGLGHTDTAHIRVKGVRVATARRDFPAPYAESSAHRAEAQPPTVKLDAPAELTLPGALEVAVEATDGDAISLVELYLDEERVSEATEPPYDFRLETSRMSTGLHTLRAIAYDRCLNQTEASLELMIRPAPVTPTATATAMSTPTRTAMPPAPTASPAPTEAPPTVSTATTLPTLPAPAADMVTLAPTLTQTLVGSSPVPTAEASARPTATALAMADVQQPSPQIAVAPQEAAAGRLSGRWRTIAGVSAIILALGFFGLGLHLWMKGREN